MLLLLTFLYNMSSGRTGIVWSTSASEFPVYVCKVTLHLPG